MNAPAVVVTGMGMVSPLGSGVEASWSALEEGRDAAAPMELFDVEGCRCRTAAQARLPEIAGASAAEMKHWPRATRLALPAAREALDQAGWLGPEGKISAPELSLSLSTTGGGMEFGEDFLRKALAGKQAGQLAHAARYQPQQQALDLQEFFGFSGPVMIVANACSSGANAIGHGADLIRAGEAEVVLAGGFEALSELIYVGFDCLQALSAEKCRPFDLNRSGLMLGEGAGFLVLESEKSARARGAAILARLSGYGHATDLHHLTQPSPNGATLAKVMRLAAEQAGAEPGRIGYVNAHGTATPMNDGAEVASYQEFFGGDLGGTKISSTKAAIGHTLGAAGSLEAIFALQALRSGRLPPQLNCLAPLPEIAPALAAERDILKPGSCVMSVNLGFGGSNAALVFSAYE